MSFPAPTFIKQKLLLLQIDLCYCGNRLVFSCIFFLNVDSWETNWAITNSLFCIIFVIYY